MRTTTAAWGRILRLTVTGALVGAAAGAAAAEWSGGSGYFDDPARWVDGVVPGAADVARFHTGGVQEVWWDASVGSQASLGLDVISSDVILKSLDGTQHAYSLFADTDVREYAALVLDRMLLDATGTTVRIGAYGPGNTSLHVTNGSSLLTATLALGENFDDISNGAFASVRDAGSIVNAGAIRLGREDKLPGAQTAHLAVEAGGKVITNTIAVAADNILGIHGVGSSVQVGLLTLGVGAELQVGDGALLESAAAGAQPGIVSFGASIHVAGGAQVQGFQNLLTTSATGFWSANPNGDSGDSFISIDGPGTTLALEDTSGMSGGFTGIGLGFGKSAEMFVSNGAEVTVQTHPDNPLPGGFAIGQDVPVDLAAILGEGFPGVFGPTGGHSLLNVSGASVEVSGTNIRGSIGSSTPVIELFDSLGLVGLQNPGGSGRLEIQQGGVVRLHREPGGWARVVAADTEGSTASIEVFGAGSTLDAGNDLYLGMSESGDPLGGSASLRVGDGATIMVDTLRLGHDADVDVTQGGAVLLGPDGVGPGIVYQHGGRFELRGAGASLTDGGGSLNINVYDGDFVVTDGATITGSGRGSAINVAGAVELRAGAHVAGIGTINLGRGFTGQDTDGSLLVEGVGTVVDIDHAALGFGPGLNIGWESASQATIRGGAVVNIGDAQAGQPPGGLLVGATLPLVFGNAGTVGQARLEVSGTGSALDIVGDNVGIGIGSPHALLAYFDLYPIFLPPELLAGAMGDGALVIADGGRVSLMAASGAGSPRTRVADAAGSQGWVSVSGFGSLFEAGDVLALGVDLAEQTTGQATLEIAQGGRVVAGRLVVGGASSVNLYTGGTLTVGQLAVAPASFNFSGGTLELLDEDLVFGAGELFGQTFTVDTQRTIEVTHNVVVNPEAVLELESNNLGADTLVNHGEVVVDGLQVGAGIGTLANEGRLSGDGQVATRLHNGASGEVRASNAERLRFTGAGNVNHGEINVLGATVEFSQDLVNGAGGFIGGRGVFGADGGIHNQGVMAFSGTTDVFGDVQNNGRIVNSGVGTLTFFDDVVHNGTEIKTAASATTVFFGDFSGAGALTGTGAVFFEGDLRPGNSPGLLVIGGDATLGAATDLVMEIGGYARGSEYDALDVGGTLTFDGALTVELLDLGGGLFAPLAGDVFALFDAADFAGVFASIVLPALAGGLFWDLGLLHSEGLLRVAAVPLPSAVWLLLSALVGLGLRRRATAASATDDTASA